MDTLIGLEDEDKFFNSYAPAAAEQTAVAPALESETELEAPLYTPEQLARAGRFRKPVALIMSALSALGVLGLVLQHRSSSPQVAAGAVVAEAPQRLAQVAPVPRSAAVTVSLSPALPAAEPAPAAEGAKAEPPSPSPAADPESITSAAFTMMTLAPARASARRSTVADARPFRMSSPRPPAAAKPLRMSQTAGAPAIARFPELER